jgi:hypothetical protein
MLANFSLVNPPLPNMLKAGLRDGGGGGAGAVDVEGAQRGAEWGAGMRRDEDEQSVKQ